MKKCKQCSAEFAPQQPLQFVCSPKCAAAYTKEKRKKKAQAEWKVKKEKLKINVTNWLDKTQTEVQKIARYIDFGLTCLARRQQGQIHGGHVYNKKIAPNIRLDLHNIHRQCAQSNKWESDDTLLREQLVEEYGQTYFDLLQETRKRPQVKYINEEYYEFYLKARKIANRLNKENKKLFAPRSPLERMALRHQINKELGIYPDYTSDPEYQTMPEPE